MWYKINTYAAGMGIQLPDDAPALFFEYHRFLSCENERVNLTRIIEGEEVLVKHFLDSLAPLAKRPDIEGPLIDIGSGAGLPGIPLKIARRGLSVTLLDSVQKKVEFVRVLAQGLNLPDVAVLHARAEDLARQPGYREHYAAAVSRAVARLNILAELCLPFVKPGGLFFAYKGPDGEQEWEEAKQAVWLLGGSLESIWRYTLPNEMGQRSLIIIKKERVTPGKYPRKAGIPVKRPL